MSSPVQVDVEKNSPPSDDRLNTVRRQVEDVKNVSFTNFI